MVRPDEEVEALLQEDADLIAITGGEAFKARAYEKAARSIGGHPADVSHLDVAGLKEILSVGRSIAEKILAQRESVRARDGRHRRMRLLHGIELNIGPEEEVDWPGEFLKGFGICVASVHSHFNVGRKAMTWRIVRACENPHVNVIGHPTTRLIGKRPGIDADWDEVCAACARTGTALEINAQPDRLDLGDEDILRARSHGAKFAVATDAPSIPQLAYLRYGIGTAQRGWCTPDDVINTWPLRRLRRFPFQDQRLRRHRQGRTQRDGPLPPLITAQSRPGKPIDAARTCSAGSGPPEKPDRTPHERAVRTRRPSSGHCGPNGGRLEAGEPCSRQRS